MERQRLEVLAELGHIRRRKGVIHAGEDLRLVVRLGALCAFDQVVEGFGGQANQEPVPRTPGVRPSCGRRLAGFLISRPLDCLLCRIPCFRAVRAPTKGTGVMRVMYDSSDAEHDPTFGEIHGRALSHLAFGHVVRRYQH